MNIGSLSKKRMYKIDVYGLQDNYIDTLQPYNSTFIGQIIQPEILINEDGTQTFNCSIPKFYIDPKTNLKVENPYWSTIERGVLAENTRILKIFLKEDDSNENVVYPFIIDKIVDKRDSHFSVYKEIECSGLAFAELGKTGYKIELNSYTIENDFEKDPTVIPTLNYWLDKVFPNKKDETGKIIQWLTPWCYELRMDWSAYSESGRASNKMYEDSYITSWKISEDSESLIANGYETGREKARYIECSNSNKYNITQDIAKTFEVFCRYEYKCDNRGSFVGDYIGEDGNIWTGRKVVFYNRAIKTEQPVVIEYQKNLTSISRTKDSSEIYTKLYVTPMESSTMDSGYITIADTTLNPTLDEFILNFDYLFQIGAISQYQLNYIKTYETEIYKINKELINLSSIINQYQTSINDLKSDLAMIEKEKSSAKEQLKEYENLRDNEAEQGPIVKNKTNSFSDVFVENNGIKEAKLGLLGIDGNSIIGYSDADYETVIFSKDNNNLVDAPVDSPESGMFYRVLDQYGYVESIFTLVDESTKDISIVYFDLTYSPKNNYVAICNSFIDRINILESSEILKEELLKTTKEKLEEKEEQYSFYLQEKERLNQKFEAVLGPALREGYWTPDSSYENHEEKVEISNVKEQNQNNVEFIFNTESITEEPIDYYIDLNHQKKYYPYIKFPIDNEGYWDWKNNIDNFILHLYYFIPTFTETTVPAGKYYLDSKGSRYYYSFTTDFQLSKINFYNSVPSLINEEGEIIRGKIEVLQDASNLLDSIEIEGEFKEKSLHNQIDFVFGFLQDENALTPVIEPVLFLKNTNLDLTDIKEIHFSIGTVNGYIGNINQIINRDDNDGVKCYYPYIVIKDSNVNYKMDKLLLQKTSPNKDNILLENYKDYNILTKNNQFYISLKITSQNNFDIIEDNYSYNLTYYTSRANEQLYLDAKKVAHENSFPKFSYDLKISNVPNDFNVYELGQLVYINDHTVGVQGTTGYISEIILKLEEPWNDEIKIKNYKTKFEDLFSTITAASEAMKNNQLSYNIAASGFNPNGTIQGQVLQNSILNNSLTMNYSKTNVEINDTDGILLTNKEAYSNGVVGQIRLTGGGIFLSNDIDGSGARIWNSGITPEGISAARITTGQLDVNKIHIFAGNNVAFQWNSEGIFAYKQKDGSVDLNTYVHYSDKGLQLVQEERVAVDLGWNGLLISTQEGATELTGDLGLTIYNGPKAYRTEEDTVAYNHVVRLGKFVNEDSTIDYGLRLYKRNDEDEYVESLVATNGGDLWLKEALIVGESKTYTYSNDNGEEITLEHGAGITGSINDTPEHKSVRFWAGSSYENKLNAPFRVLQDGTLHATQALIKGSVEAESGKIGGWNIEQNKITSNGISLNAGTTNTGATIIVGNVASDQYVQINGNGYFEAKGVEINGTINATGGSIGNLQITDINENLKKIVIEITSSNGNIVKTGETFTTTLTATVKKGGLILKEDELNNYTYDWQDSTDGDEWETILEGKGEYFFSYSPDSIKKYIRCIVTIDEQEAA